MKKKKNNAPEATEGVKDNENGKVDNTTDEPTRISVDDSTADESATLTQTSDSEVSGDVAFDKKPLADNASDDNHSTTFVDAAEGDPVDSNEDTASSISRTDDTVETDNSLADNETEGNVFIVEENENTDGAPSEADGASNDKSISDTAEPTAEREDDGKKDVEDTHVDKALGDLEGIIEYVKKDEAAGAKSETEAEEDDSESSLSDEKNHLIDALDQNIVTRRRNRKPRHAEPSDDSDGQSTRKIDALFDFIELFVFTLAAVLIITAFLVRHSVVDGDSMMDTLHDKENLLISNLFYDPKPGDIIVVEDFSTALKKPIVKRVIAVGGQTVRVQKDGVYIDGEREKGEDYIFIDEVNYEYEVYPSSALGDNDTLVYVPGEYYEFTVPDGELFVMGDHRNKSTDSRDIGTVDEDAVLGRVILRFYPFDKFGTVD